MKSYSAKEVIRRLKAEGWTPINAKGGHRQFVHPTKRDKVSVSYHSRDITIGTIKSIENKAA